MKGKTGAAQDAYDDPQQFLVVHEYGLPPDSAYHVLRLEGVLAG
jgi:hypothetical protein